MINTLKKSTIALLACTAFSSAYGQNGLLNDLNTRPLTARAAALGNAGATLVDDASALAINPAGLARIYGFQFVGSHELGYRSGKLVENGSIPNYSESVVENVKPLLGINQAAISFPFGRSVNVGLGYAKLSNFTQFKEDWTVRQESGSNTAYDKIIWNYSGAFHTVNAGFGWGTNRSSTKSNLYVGMSLNRLFGTKTSDYKKSFVLNGNTVSNSDYNDKFSVSGMFAGFGLIYETATTYWDSDFNLRDKNQFSFSISGNLPYWRRNERNTGTTGSNVSYTYKPGTLTLGMALKLIRYSGFSSTRFVTPMVQYEITDLSQNRVYYPTNGAADPALTDYNGNRLSLGMEFSNSYDEIKPRLGMRFQRFLRKDGSGEQEKTWGICAGVGGEYVDFAATVDFFKSEKVLTYSGGGAIDYNGAILGAMLTYRF